MRFVAIDVETANPDVASICQIGIAKFENGTLVAEWSTLVDPEDYFDDVNISVHGIEARMVRGKPTLPAIADTLRSLLHDTICVCHTHFDRVAVTRALAKYSIEPLATTWLDSARVARRAWNEVAYSGYGLANVCRLINYEFHHHDALEDAKAAGHVVLAAMRVSNLDLDGWIRRVSQPIEPSQSSYGSALHREGNPEGDLYGETVVFTGALAVPRRDAADMAARIGCRVDPGVTRRTTILVVGDQDAIKLSGLDKSSKHRKAEQLVAEGQAIRIIRETDFLALAGDADRGA